MACQYADRREERLVEYLYDEMPAPERRAFDDHLSSCRLCREELDALGMLRMDLGRWTPPALAGRVVFEPAAEVPRRSRALRRLGELPTWARLAAAVLVLGVSTGLANLEIRSTSGGVSIRTGWSHPDPGARPLVASVPVDDPKAASSAPWRNDLVALEHTLRDAIEARAVGSSRTSEADDALLRRVRALLQESEERQLRELALRVAEATRDIQAQRQADLVRIDRTLGVMQSRTGLEVMRTQQQVNSLAQRVSQRP